MFFGPNKTEKPRQAALEYAPCVVVKLSSIMPLSTVTVVFVAVIVIFIKVLRS
jgi:hypothetical protein